MARSVWKGPYVDHSLINKIEDARVNQKKAPIKTWSRSSVILPTFVGFIFAVYNGKKHIPVSVTENMIGHKLGEFSPTRSVPSHSGGKKKGK